MGAGGRQVGGGNGWSRSGRFGRLGDLVGRDVGRRLAFDDLTRAQLSVSAIISRGAIVIVGGRSRHLPDPACCSTWWWW